MQIEIPKTEHPMSKLVATAGDWTHKRYMGPLYRTYDVPVPEGIAVSDLEVTVEPCDNAGKSLGPAVVVKYRTVPTVVKPIPAAEAAPELVEPKPERKPRVKRKLRDQEIAQDERPTEQPPAAD